MEWTGIDSRIGSIGSENGIILHEEEYRHSCVMTLEQCGAHYAITCGICGSFVHTAYCGSENYVQMYETMERKLQNFMDADTTHEEELRFYEEFASAF